MQDGGSPESVTEWKLRGLELAREAGFPCGRALHTKSKTLDLNIKVLESHQSQKVRDITTHVSWIIEVILLAVGGRGLKLGSRRNPGGWSLDSTRLAGPPPSLTPSPQNPLSISETVIG